MDYLTYIICKLLPFHENPAISCNLCSSNKNYFTTSIYWWWLGLYSNAYCVFKMKTKVLWHSKEEVVSYCHILVPVKSRSGEIFNMKIPLLLLIPVLLRDLLICFHIEWFRCIRNIERTSHNHTSFFLTWTKLSKSSKITRLSGRPTFFMIALKHLDIEG